MPLRSAVSPAALRLIREAFEDLERTVTPLDAKEFESSTLQNVQNAALEIEDRLAARQSLRNMRRLMPLFNGLDHYSKSLEVLCNGTPFLPWIWAPIKLILTISSDFVDAFEKVIKHYSCIGTSLTRFGMLENTFNGNAEFQNVLAVYYCDILRFHKEAYKFVRRRSWTLFFHTSFGRFQTRFEDIVANLKAHEELLDKTANAINIAEARKERLKLEERRKEQLEAIEREELHKASQQYQDIVSWLKVDQTDQTLILDCITEEALRFPSGCDWILKLDDIKSWMRNRPDTPFLWLQGKPGSGKSVLASQIIAFLHSASHSLVVSHFCTYSYASSTRYDLILRSILLQLIQGNVDLIAYVYKLKETEFAKRSVTPLSLERLIRLLVDTLSKNPAETRYVHIVLDGLDECEEEKQGRLITLLEQVVSSTSSSKSVVCKLLLLSRNSGFLKKRFRKKTTISLTEQAAHLEKAIQSYAGYKFQSLRQRLSQIGVGDADFNDMAATIAKKADGMFLWARLVLGYISKNMFYTKDEILSAVQELPRELSDFYHKILTQILDNFDTRSTERLKSIFGWIAYAKRPLTITEFQSALAFTRGALNVTEAVPSYLFSMCAPLIEERTDSTFSFIHVSVKDYLEGENSRRLISPITASLEQATASVSCLLSGVVLFNSQYSTEERGRRVVKGLHAFHVYANEYWLDHLLAIGTSDQGFDEASRLYALMHMLSSELTKSDESSTFARKQLPESASADAQLRCLASFEGLYRTAKVTLQARSARYLDENTPSSETDAAATGLSGTLAAYQSTVRSILPRREFPGVSMEDLERFKRSNRTTAFTCRLGGCARATIGFEDDELRLQHERSHVQHLYCDHPGCQYPPLTSSRALRSHISKCHEVAAVKTRAIRKNMADGFLDASKSNDLGLKVVGFDPYLHGSHRWSPHEFWPSPDAGGSSSNDAGLKDSDLNSLKLEDIGSRVRAAYPPRDNPPSPPKWLTQALQSLLQTYRDDSFGGVMRYCALNDQEQPVPLPAPDQPVPPGLNFYYIPRIWCHDCPGKLYRPGPDGTAANFEVHLKNRLHRENVLKRLDKEKNRFQFDLDSLVFHEHVTPISGNASVGRHAVQTESGGTGSNNTSGSTPKFVVDGAQKLSGTSSLSGIEPSNGAHASHSALLSSASGHSNFSQHGENESMTVPETEEVERRTTASLAPVDDSSLNSQQKLAVSQSAGYRNLFKLPTYETPLKINDAVLRSEATTIMNGLMKGMESIAFEQHINTLNPTLGIGESNYLVQRIAVMQFLRYNSLLEKWQQHDKVTKPKKFSCEIPCENTELCTASIGGGIIAHPQESLTVIEAASEDILTPPTKRFPATFECRLCYCRITVGMPSDWSNHVLEDIRPYTCTWPECSQRMAFRSKANWLAHENGRHRHPERWLCNVEDCHFSSDDQDIFKGHLVVEHVMFFNLENRLRDCRVTPVVNNVSQEPCRFCGRIFTKWIDLTDDLATHMERFTKPLALVVEMIGTQDVPKWGGLLDGVPG